MKINLNSLNVINNIFHKPQETMMKPSFGSAKTKKLMEQILNAKDLKKVHLTFYDVVDIYSDLGYDVIMKRGSHAIVPITDKINLPVVIPHGSKYVHPCDIKRLRYIINGEIQKALSV